MDFKRLYKFYKKFKGMNKKFALIGASGYIAPRHMQAIKETGGELVAAFDPFDSIGIMDSFFPNSKYFNEFERFERFVDKSRNNKLTKIDYVSVASPNFLHDSHIRFALKNDCDVICEKPLVLNPHNIHQLIKVQTETNRKVYSILQLRLHPQIEQLKKNIEDQLSQYPRKIFDIELTYITSRGPWYDISWKGDLEKSGGIATNIGIHFFDMLSWIFGEVIDSKIFLKDQRTNSGILSLKNANIKWFLSIDKSYLPDSIIRNNSTTYRSISIEGEEIEFSNGFIDLHTESYSDILKGNGFGIEEALQSIEIVSSIRNMKVSEKTFNYHSFLQ
jgi:UDP-N-acetyl-2-amino-2-deoxyglucuronate dehydrogenase